MCYSHFLIDSSFFFFFFLSWRQGSGFEFWSRSFPLPIESLFVYHSFFSINFLLLLFFFNNFLFSYYVTSHLDFPEKLEKKLPCYTCFARTQASRFARCWFNSWWWGARSRSRYSRIFVCLSFSDFPPLPLYSSRLLSITAFSIIFAREFLFSLLSAMIFFDDELFFMIFSFLVSDFGYFFLLMFDCCRRISIL